MYTYRHFIPQNIAPKGTKSIGVYNSKGEKVCQIPLGGMTPPAKAPLYSFGLVSDIHLYPLSAVNWTPETKFDKALTYFENHGCAFCVVCGDLTQTGLYREGDKTTLAPEQMAKYKEICDSHAIDVFELMGNHESYVNPISNNLAEMQQYTGNENLHYLKEFRNDVFIFCGHPSGSIPMSDEAFAFLSNTLAANSNKRCFVFVHPLWNDDSGDAGGAYSNHSSGGGTLLSSWSKGNALKELLRQYPQTLLFHGHTHIKFEEQEKDKDLNYTHKNGFHSVHIPSLGRPRNIVGGSLVYVPAESQGYLVDVYDDCVVLNGMNMISETFVPLGVFKINTDRNGD